MSSYVNSAHHTNEILVKDLTTFVKRLEQQSAYLNRDADMQQRHSAMLNTLEILDSVIREASRALTTHAKTFAHMTYEDAKTENKKA